MIDNEPYLAERMSLIKREWKYTFLKPYGNEMKGHILVIKQHTHMPIVETSCYDINEMYYQFGDCAGTIIGHINKPIPIYLPKII